MPDEYGNFRGIKIPLIPWQQVFEPGDRVRITATQQLGTVAAPPDHGYYPVDLDDSDPSYYPPGELRPA